MFQVRRPYEPRCNTCDYWDFLDDGDWGPRGLCFLLPPVGRGDDIDEHPVTLGTSFCASYRTDHGLADGESHVTRQEARRAARVARAAALAAGVPPGTGAP
jgi:hypothetical protein